MSKRLQVLLSEAELDEIRDTAKQAGVTVSEWVRDTLRLARQQRASGDASRKLAAVRVGARHTYPTADIEQMLGEIEQGYQ